MIVLTLVIDENMYHEVSTSLEQSLHVSVCKSGRGQLDNVTVVKIVKVVG